ncbi:MAG TPA: QueT transporter family protein [Candidatus Atopostipes pullistercoris]|uniref:QueT transporter family protein n=1 Tax=Candidatus Atopostipes pullistercoris TaxID=2838467 RepID=A0A9D2G3P2_9LACT|nr:QueT transporter family protein [Candidatus Atopostipes pullistercoris]
MKLSIRQLTLNAMIAAIYVVITIFLPSYGPLQLRLTEMFAHLPMFNKKYSIGLVLGVAIANIRSEFGIYDIIFGTLHTALSLLIVFLIIKESDSLIKKMLINTAVFTAMSFILALMVSILTNEMFFFWVNYASFAASIAIVMLVTIPVILFLDKQIHFDETMER